VAYKTDSAVDSPVDPPVDFHSSPTGKAMQMNETQVFAQETVQIEQLDQSVAAVELLDAQLALIGGGFGGIPMF
jgi:hypothetical protein